MPKILVIEDEQIVRHNILELLSSEGFDTLEAENGQMGVQLAEEHSPDLIICDIMMPQLDGYGVLKALHQNPSTRMIPLIFLTAKSDWDAFRRGMSLGADDYLTKPFSRAELLDAIATRLTKHRAVVQLQEQVAQLQQSNSVREEFVSTAAHELRGPLSNIRMAIEMLETSRDSDDQQFYLEILKISCDREVDLINDLLDLQRLEASSELPLKQSLNLNLWIKSLAEPFQIRAQKRQQLIDIDIAADLPAFVTEELSLQRILNELLNNACKYTPPNGKIIVTAAVQPIDDNVSIDNVDAVMQIVVSNPAEIPVKALPHLFDRFYRVPGGDPWKQGGTGLGLTLSKKLAERLGGSLDVSSQGGWTHFAIALPMSKS